MFECVCVCVCVCVWKNIQSNLCTTTTLWAPKKWPLLTGGCCAEVALCYTNWNCDPKIVVVVGKWLLFGGGRKLRFDGITLYPLKVIGLWIVQYRFHSLFAEVRFLWSEDTKTTILDLNNAKPTIFPAFYGQQIMKTANNEGRLYFLSFKLAC